MPVLSLTCHLPHNTPNIPSRYNNEQTTKQTKAINNSYIYISHVNVTQTVPDISPLMPMHQDPLLVAFTYQTCVPETGPWFNIKMSPCQYRKSHCGDKTVVRSSYLIMGFPILVRRHLYIESGPRYLGRGKKLHPPVSVGYNYLSLPLIPASGT